MFKSIETKKIKFLRTFYLVGVRVLRIFAQRLYPHLAMAIPDFQTMMLPTLTFLGDGIERNSKEINDYLSNYYHLTEEEINELLPSGTQPRFKNRIA